MTYIINGEEVEYLHIKEINGNTVVEYAEKFDIVSAHMSEIMKRLRNNGLHNSLVFKKLRYNLIIITYKNESEITRILHLFNIKYGSYEVMEEDKSILIQV